MLRVGLVGFGHWAPNYARLLSGPIPSARLVACADSSASRLRLMQQRHPDARACHSHLDLLEERLDAVIVATPASTHRPVVEDFLNAGIHVLVEKPMAETSQDCVAMVELAEARGLILMVGHTFLFNPAVRQIKRYIDEGELGNVLYVYFQRTGLGPIRQDVNALWDLAPHDISMMRYWTGEDPIELEARGQAYLRPDLEDVVFLTLHYPRKLMACIHVSWLDPVKVRRATIVGDRKMAVFDDVHPTEKLRVYDKGASYQPVDGDFAAFVASVRDGEIVIPRVENQEPLTAQVSHFIECVETGRRPLTDGHDGLAVVRALERAQDRLESSRLPSPTLTAEFREVASSR